MVFWFLINLLRLLRIRRDRLAPESAGLFLDPERRVVQSHEIVPAELREARQPAANRVDRLGQPREARGREERSVPSEPCLVDRDGAPRLSIRTDARLEKIPGQAAAE